MNHGPADCLAADMLLTTLRQVATLLLAVAVLPTATPSAQGPGKPAPKLDAELSARLRNGVADWQRVIIRTIPGEMPGLAAILRERGSHVARLHPLIDGLTATLPVERLEGLARLPFVISISLDAVVTATQTTSDTPSLRETLGLRPQARSGSRVGVAIIDSGLEAGPEFDERVQGFYDFTDGGHTASPSDAYGHGTHVAGLIAGNGDLSQKRYRGIAPKA